MKHVFLIDGSGYIFRAFHALPTLTKQDGTPIGAVLGFTNMLLKFLNEEKPDHMVVVFDAGRKNFRNDIFPAYKANRAETPPELIPQFSIIRDVCQAFDVPSIEMEGFEADDLIATYAQEAVKKGAEVTIVSSDKDLMQLVGPHISMLDPMKNRRIQEAEVIEKFGVPPQSVIDVQALAGDKTDNVPGVPGIGVKTAAELILHYKDLETLLEHAHEIKQNKRRELLLSHREDALLSKQLVTLKQDVPVGRSVETFEIAPLNPEKVITFLKDHQFHSLLTRFERLKAASLDRAETIPTTPSSTYELVQDKAALERWITEIVKVGYVAFDTETTSLDAMQAELVGISLSYQLGIACYIPLQHKQKTDLLTQQTSLKQLALQEVLDLLKPILSNPGVLKIGQNIKYDMLILKKYGVDISPVEDTMLLSYLLDGGKHGHGMDELSKLHLDHETIKYTDVVGSGKNQVTFDYVPLETARNYAAEDADITYQLFQILKPRLVAERLSTLYETVEKPLIPVIVDMENAGIQINAVELKKLSHEFSLRLNVLEQEIYQIVGQSFNVASPKQLGEILFDKMGLSGGKKGKTGAYSTSASVLEDLAEQGVEVATKVLQWRQLAKLKSTYADALVNQINPRTGRVHTSYSMATTLTGRLASSDPNLQNIPIRTEEGIKIRQAFIAPPGHKLMSVDYSQIELRLLAHMANIAPLKEAFHQGKDIHVLTASQIFGTPIADVSHEMRRRAKTINFGIIYGISPFGLAQQLGISREEAVKAIQAYLACYPGIQEYMDNIKNEARQKGYVTTLLGRRCHIPGINDKNPVSRAGAERQAINAPLQGSNADIIKKAMIAIPPALKNARLQTRMLLQVHDELIFEVPETEVEMVSLIIKNIMENVVSISVPLIADVGVGHSWADAHS